MIRRILFAALCVLGLGAASCSDEPSEAAQEVGEETVGNADSYPQVEMPIEGEDAAEDMMAAPVCMKEVPPDTICTMDINACGHASSCNCGQGYIYNAAMGKCALDLAGVGEATFIETTDNDCIRPANGVCTRDINACGQPSNCGCDAGYIWNDVAGKCIRNIAPG